MTFLKYIYGFSLGITLLLVSFSYSNVHSQQIQCSIDIINVPSVMHPGQFLNLKSIVNSNNGISDYTWTIQGPAIKEYDDDVYQSSLLSAPFNLIPPIPLSSADLKNPEVSFYWQLDPVNENRNVTLNVKNINEETCTDTKTFKVKMGNTTITQAEDFYVEKNHPLPGPDSTNILQQHRQWHDDYDVGDNTYNNNGDLFFDFHKLYIAHFDKWRDTFGYSLIESWNPGTPLPTGVTIDHENREVSYIPRVLPSWFTMHPGIDGPDRVPLALPCETADAPRGSFPAVQDELIDFEPDQELLGCVLTHPYHNGRHVAVGGDMLSTADAPRDPIFWRYHKYIDDVSQKRFNPISITEGLAEGEVNVFDNTIPRIFSQNPFRLYPYITELPILTEKEKNLFGKTGIEALSAQFTEPVIGVKAEDFKVNGSPANNVTGKGTGPYVFIGFDSPQYGPINVTLSSGNITNEDGNKFLGDSWNYFLVEPEQDLDNDGVANGIEVDVYKSNVTNADSDDDGIIDGTETVNPCLDPMVNDDMEMTHMRSMDMNTLELEESQEPLDYDSDGISNVEEASENADPCSQQSSFDSAAGLTETDTNVTNNISKFPFILVLQRDGGFAGGSDMLVVDSTSSKSITIKNGNLTEGKLNEDMIDNLKRIVNNSQLFEAKNFYSPPEGSADHIEYSITVTINGKSQSIAWTDASKDVPPNVANLPYILDYMNI